MTKPRALKRTVKKKPAEAYDRAMEEPMTTKMAPPMEASPSPTVVPLTSSDVIPVSPSALTKISRVQSTNVVKNMIRVSVSEICYLRSLFPEDVFRKRVYADMHIHCLAPEKDGTDTAMRDALALTLWMEEGAFEALEKEYLEQVVFCIYAVGKDAKPDKLLESYSFKIRNTPDATTLTTNFLGDEVVSSDPEKIKDQAIQMIRSLVSITNSLDALPGNRLLTMKLTYNETCPHDWQPKYFKQATSDLSEEFVKPSLKVDLGRIVTPFHFVSMRLEASEDAFQVAAQELPQGGFSQAQVPMSPTSDEGHSFAGGSPPPCESPIVAIQSALSPSPIDVPTQRATQPSQALAKEDIMKYCVQFETVEMSEILARFDLAPSLMKKRVDELCAEKVLIPNPDNVDSYRVGVYQDLSYYQAIQFAHGKLRRSVSVLALAKCFSWTLLFSKAIIMRMHHEHLVDMSKPPSFNGYPVLYDASKGSHTSSSGKPILQTNHAPKKRRMTIQAISMTPVPFL
ncbi:hypothetical protein SPRG_03266 [Saprolegnia parasitica CBS 223.65]|uniref:HORMA domain-containing protein n=1 Tax=Saprolegnia parasitica (strain CBS 223.65) TaxID=695850 RepID=A0A067CNF5_SAPPC|nr:hypothetical protein SPRG_03266 [Saprolegnia parasitica CBS 223.65]KDO32048.1 hypothetical protein SPRG_03266 [Saprolegnia parasitica CBS 223.65]|eukprot:XP_012197236.1 hypothetical protein SPRG_03266 [Saprolegnia parasitica CBS 223.65]